MKIDSLIEPGTNLPISCNAGLQKGDSVFKALEKFGGLPDRVLLVYDRDKYIGRLSQTEVLHTAIKAYAIEKSTRFQLNLRVTHNAVKLKNLLNKSGLIDNHQEMVQLLDQIIRESKTG